MDRGSEQSWSRILGFVFSSIVKSVGYSLNVNCSLDKFLDKRKAEYSRYLYASLSQSYQYRKGCNLHVILEIICDAGSNNPNCHGKFM